jgi:uncharacterized membrane protein
MEQHKLDRFYIFIFVLLNVLLKLLYVSNAEIAIDEPFSIMVAQMPIAEILSFLGDGNNPPLFEIILHPVVLFLGIDVPWVRLPSVLFSSLTVIYIYLIGSRFVNSRVAIGAALIFTFATFQIYFAHEARVYALFNLLATASVYYFLLFFKTPTLKIAGALVFCNVLLLYSHYLGAVLLFIEACWFVAVNLKKPKRILHFGLICLLTIVLLLPQILMLYHRFLTGTFEHWLKAPSISDLYYNILKMLNAPVVAVVCLVIFIAALIKVWLSRKQSVFSFASPAVFILWWFVVGYFGLFIVSFWVPVFLERYLIFVSSALYLLIPIAIRYLWCEEKMMPAITIAVLFFMFSVSLKPDHGRRWQPLIEKIKATTTAQDGILIAPGWNYPLVAYLYNRAYFKDFKNTVQLLQKNNIYCVYNEASLDLIPVDSFVKVILLDGGIAGTTIYQRLRKTHPNISTQKDTKGVVVYYFSK